MADSNIELGGQIFKAKELTDGKYALAVTDYLEGYASTFTHGTINCGTVSGTLLAANTSRLYAYFQNDGADAAYITLGTPAVKNKGIRLNANGGSYEISKRGGNLYTGAITAITGGTVAEALLYTQGV